MHALNHGCSDIESLDLALDVAVIMERMTEWRVPGQVFMSLLEDENRMPSLTEIMFDVASHKRSHSERELSRDFQHVKEPIRAK